MKNTKAAGNRRERQVRDELERDGWSVRKARMSFGAADLLAYNPVTKERMLVQVKANTGSPYKNFIPADRQLLIEDARIAGARAFLVHWPPHGDCEWIPEEDWPT